jgi:S-adenosylmethionine hydrolase
MIDVAHDLPRGDPRAAAFWLRFVLPEFPPAVHCAVVDPGVGTDRDALVVRAGAHVLVAPDNGLAMPPARALAEGEGGEPERVDAFAVDVDEPASRTFHGRDVFAPVAARVRAALDDGPGRAGPEGVAAALDAMDELSPAADPVDIAFPEPTVERDDDGDPVAVDGEVLVIDRFGNVVTNVPGELVRGSDWIRVNGELTPVAETFGAVDPGDRLVTVGSHGYVECDVNDGRGDGAFDLRPGDEVRLVGDNVSL